MQKVMEKVEKSPGKSFNLNQFFWWKSCYLMLIVLCAKWLLAYAFQEEVKHVDISGRSTEISWSWFDSEFFIVLKSYPLSAFWLLAISGKFQFRVITYNLYTFSVVLTFWNLSFLIRFLIFGIKISILFIKILILVVHKLRQKSDDLKFYIKMIDSYSNDTWQLQFWIELKGFVWFNSVKFQNLKVEEDSCMAWTCCLNVNLTYQLKALNCGFYFQAVPNDNWAMFGILSTSATFSNTTCEMYEHMFK